MLLFVLNRSSSALDLGLPTSPRHTVPTLPQHRTRALTGESASAEGTRGVVGRPRPTLEAVLLVLDCCSCSARVYHRAPETTITHAARVRRLHGIPNKNQLSSASTYT